MKRILNNKANIWNLLGIIIGVVAIVIGIVFLKRQFYDVSEIGKITFGADFYTEMYDVGRRIYNLLGHINDFIEYVKSGFGFSFILFGALDIILFGRKITENIADEKVEIVNEIQTETETKKEEIPEIVG